MPLFRLSGLTVAADIPLPGVIPLEPEAAARLPVDVIIRQCPVPADLDAPAERRAFYQVSPDRFLLTLPEIGRFLATGGRLLEMDPAPGSAPEDALPFVLGTGMGAILYQRGTLVLHASAVAWRGRAYLFCGPTGMGKSTLAAALCRAGCRLISDDIAALGLDGDGRVVVHGDGRQLKLFTESIDHLDLGGARGGAVRCEIEKYHVEPPHGGETEQVPLATIHQLREALPPLAPGLLPLSTVDAAQVLLNESYRRPLALAYAGRTGMTATMTAAVLRQVSIRRLVVRRGLDLLPRTVADLMTGWTE